MDNVSKKVAEILLQINAVSLNPKSPFKYASGILSPVYTDCRLLMSFPKERGKVRDLYIEAIEKLGGIDLIAGTATAGIPHAAWIADKLGLPMVYVRSSQKDHGKGNKIEGLVGKGSCAIVVEDLISTGESSVNSAKAVRESGAKVDYVISIMSYGMKKAEENFAQNNLKLITLTTFTDLLDVAQTLGKINPEEKETILEWTKDPISWGKKMGFE